MEPARCEPAQSTAPSPSPSPSPAQPESGSGSGSESICAVLPSMNSLFVQCNDPIRTRSIHPNKQSDQQQHNENGGNKSINITIATCTMEHKSTERDQHQHQHEQIKHEFEFKIDEQEQHQPMEMKTNTQTQAQIAVLPTSTVIPVSPTSTSTSTSTNQTNDQHDANHASIQRHTTHMHIQNEPSNNDHSVQTSATQSMTYTIDPIPIPSSSMSNSASVVLFDLIPLGSNCSIWFDDKSFLQYVVPKQKRQQIKPAQIETIEATIHCNSKQSTEQSKLQFDLETTDTIKCQPTTIQIKPSTLIPTNTMLPNTPPTKRKRRNVVQPIAQTDETITCATNSSSTASSSLLPSIRVNSKGTPYSSLTLLEHGQLYEFIKTIPELNISIESNIPLSMLSISIPDTLMSVWNCLLLEREKYSCWLRNALFQSYTQRYTQVTNNVMQFMEHQWKQNIQNMQTLNNKWKYVKTIQTKKLNTGKN
jgi:hypothetical protein